MTPPIITDFLAVPLPAQTNVVLLDFDNTCYEYEPCHEVALRAVATALAPHFSDHDDFLTRYKEAQSLVKKQIPTHGASHSRVLYFQRLLEGVGAPHLLSTAAAMEALYWESFMAAMQPTVGLVDFLAECRRNGTKVVVVSDLTTTIQCRKIAALGIADYLTTMVTSEEAGAEKPDAAPFLLALQKSGCDAAAAVMIGDSHEKDIAGAQALGIAAILFTHAEAISHTRTRSPRNL